MKKLVLTAAIVLTMGLTAFAQQGDGVMRRSSLMSNRDATTPIFPQGWGEEEDQEGAPVGSGIAVLVGLGAAYLVGKKRKEE
jgi:hypothetical protein